MITVVAAATPANASCDAAALDTLRILGR